MKYTYYNPNLYLRDIFQAIHLGNDSATLKLEDFYRSLTGKKYILLTNSCRTALYLTWKALARKGEVITSPLTCKVAIDPITEADNVSVFADINKNSLNIEASDIEHRITDNTIAVQAIHFGGISCEMNEIVEIANRNNIYVIEDCAQSLGAKFNGQFTGSFGDVACFSLIKNAYGIGGGVLATNNKEVYEKALEINSTFSKLSRLLLFYRLIRNLSETNYKSLFGSLGLKFLKRLKGKKKSYQTVHGQLKKISPLEKKIAANQLAKLPVLHEARKNIGNAYSNLLKTHGLLCNQVYLNQDSSYTKYYIYNPSINYKQKKNILHEMGIEVKHLSQDMNGTYQGKFVENDAGLKNYLSVHDSLVSLPLTETMEADDLHSIVERIKNIIRG